MLIVYIDNDAQMRERITETFRQRHNVETFPELFEAYKWIKHNAIPELIVTEMDVDSPTGLQSLKFLESKVKLKQTRKIGYATQPQSTADAALAEGAAALFAKEKLMDELKAMVSQLEKKSSPKTLRDVQVARQKKSNGIGRPATVKG